MHTCTIKDLFLLTHSEHQLGIIIGSTWKIPVNSTHYLYLFGIVFYGRLIRLNEDVYASPNVWKMYTVSYMHYSTIGTLVGIATGLAVSLLFPTDEKVDPRLLTPCIRNFVYPKYMAETVTNGKTTHNKTDTYELVSQETKLWRLRLYAWRVLYNDRIVPSDSNSVFIFKNIRKIVTKLVFLLLGNVPT